MKPATFKSAGARPLYYGQFSMVFSGDLDYISFLRLVKTPDEVLTKVKPWLDLQRDSVKRLQLASYEQRSQSYIAPFVAKLLQEKDATNITAAFDTRFQELNSLFNLIASIDKNKNRIVYAYGSLKVYSNDASIMTALMHAIKWDSCAVLQVENVLPKGVYRKARVIYKYRTYFRPQLLETSQVQAILTHLRGLQNVNYSPGIEKLLSRSRSYVQSHYYIEYNTAAEISFLHLMFPGLLGRSITYVETEGK